jgi:Fur family transcriptional regulator, ferric uptake regulator
MSPIPNDAARRLKACGLRSTRPRRILVRVLAEAPPGTGPLEIFECARQYDRRISRATVYRFLARLRRAGVATPVRLSGEVNAVR